MRKPPIVILHGWGLSSDRFLPLSSEFESRGYNVFTPDLPGFGASKMPTRPLYLGDYALFLKGYIASNHIESPLIVGHSFGGRVSLKFAADNPESVLALVLSGTPGFTPIPSYKLNFFIVLAKVGGYLFSLPFLKIMKDYVRKLYYYLVGARDFYRAEGVMRETFKHIVQEELHTSMVRIRMSCLLLWGEEDQLVPRFIPKKMSEIIVGSKLVFVGNVGHDFPFIEPKKFADEVEKFLVQSSL